MIGKLTCTADVLQVCLNVQEHVKALSVIWDSASLEEVERHAMHADSECAEAASKKKLKGQEMAEDAEGLAMRGKLWLFPLCFSYFTEQGI